MKYIITNSKGLKITYNNYLDAIDFIASKEEDDCDCDSDYTIEMIQDHLHTVTPTKKTKP